jgi:hypothetical protein
MEAKIVDTVTVKCPENKRTGVMVISVEDFDPKVHTKVKPRTQVDEEKSPSKSKLTEVSAEGEAASE